MTNFDLLLMDILLFVSDSTILALDSGIFAVSKKSFFFSNHLYLKNIFAHWWLVNQRSGQQF